MRHRRWIGAGAVIALALTLVTIRSLEAPLLLYPNSASLPAGLYMRSFEPVQRGAIVAFFAPTKARRYQERSGAGIPSGFMFIKPVAAGPGDHVCNDLTKGLEINDTWMAPVARNDRKGRPLPIWRSCRRLRENEFFMFSDTVSNSFDSRYFGIVQVRQILATYRQIL